MQTSLLQQPDYINFVYSSCSACPYLGYYNTLDYTLNSCSSYDKPRTVTTTDFDSLMLGDETLHVYTVPFSARVTGPCWSEELLLTTEPLLSVH